MTARNQPSANIAGPGQAYSSEISHALDGLKEIIYARLDAMDKAIIILQDIGNRQPTVNEVFLQHAERIAAIAHRFEEKFDTIERYRIEQKKDTSDALAAALQAAEKAVREQTLASERAITKSETGTAKQIDHQGLLITTTTAGLNDKIDDIKGRITVLEGRGQGKSDSMGIVVGVGGLALALIAAAVAVIALFKH